MSQDHVERVLGRMLTDDLFRHRVSLGPAEACREEGYLLSDEEMQLVGKIDVSRLSSVATSLDGGIKRFSVLVN